MIVSLQQLGITYLYFNEIVEHPVPIYTYTYYNI